MNGTYHGGELEMQRRAGTLEDAASRDRQGGVWASLLSGPAGFMRVRDGTGGQVEIAARPHPDDPLLENLHGRPELGILAFDPATRQRFRVNGKGSASPAGIVLEVEQAYGNCPKYIQKRALVAAAVATASSAAVVTNELDEAQRSAIENADTLFIASYHPRGGADASHRGGLPGFVRVSGPRQLSFQDYPGNGMFNTLGNLIGHPQAGLLFLDFASGDTLQLGGTARVRKDFTVVFDIAQVRATRAAGALRFRFLEYSPAIPGQAANPLPVTCGADGEGRGQSRAGR